MQPRITPAGAGKTTLTPAHNIPNKDHPRRCGENMKEKRLRYGPPGSPPQVRGKRQCMKLETLKTRITPAGAGKTLLRRHCKHHIQDHPRRCGENFSLVSLLFAVLGSPPQVRGKHSPKSEQRAPFGITPAGAGKTRPARLSPWVNRDHPRRCGENIYLPFHCYSVRGSPPQVRGKLSIPSLSNDDNRITPADAGKTLTASRLCPKNPGSPPRMRGKLTQSSMSILHTGITPADAGKTLFSLFGTCGGRDHPRGCGENYQNHLKPHPQEGSPPRMRGKPLFCECIRSKFRITPADAGKTLKRSFRNQPFCSRAVQISFNFSNSLNVSLQSGSAR